LRAFDAGEFYYEGVYEPFWDWFCRDSELREKIKVLFGLVKEVVGSPKVNPEKQYVFFKNNCPLGGELYDDFRICDLKTDKVVYTVVLRYGYGRHEGRTEVWGKRTASMGRWLSVAPTSGQCGWD
jgi:hypothetical protein